jgi:dTDP-4-dehydrorhamnose reductase
MKKLLVTGASGFLGWHVCQAAAPHWDVYGTVCNHPVAVPQTKVFRLDLTDFAALRHLFHTLRPDAVIHLAAQSQPNWCQQHPDESHRMNVTVAVTMAELCSDRAIPYVFTSTDLVFDGRQPPYTEADPVSPLSLYGEQKAQAEVEILQRYPLAAVCRMPLMFGVVPPPAKSFIQPFIQTLQAGEALKLFCDEFRTPVSGTTAAQGLLLALKSVQGRLHLGGRERISRYDFGRLLAEVFALPTDRLTACRQQDVPMPAPRPADVSLDSAIAFGLGYAPLPLRAALEALRTI